MKPTHKFQTLASDVPAALAAAKSRSAAARSLGVNRSTLNRWIKAGKVALPTPRKRARTTNHEPSALPALPTCSAAEWARGIREKYDLSPTDLLVLLMAEHMAVVALDNTAKFAHRQAAAGRWQRLSLQLDLEEETENDGEAEGPSTRGTVRSWPRRVG